MRFSYNHQSLFLHLSVITLLSHVFSIDAYPQWTINTYPNSFQTPHLCNVERQSLVCDPNRILMPFNSTLDGVTLLSQLTSRIQQTTNCSCLAEDAEFGSCNKLYTQGYTISVAVMRSLKMNASKMDEQSRLEAIRNFADSLRRRLNRGQCDDDALIAVAIDERAVWTSVGKVTERRLSEDHIMAITAQAESLFSKGLYTDGLRYMLESYEKVLQGGTVAISSTFPWPLPLWVIITAACLGLLLIVLLISIVVLKFCLPKRDHYTLGVRQPQQQR